MEQTSSAAGFQSGSFSAVITGPRGGVKLASLALVPDDLADIVILIPFMSFRGKSKVNLINGKTVPSMA